MTKPKKASELDDRYVMQRILGKEGAKELKRLARDLDAEKPKTSGHKRASKKR